MDHIDLQHLAAAQWCVSQLCALHTSSGTARWLTVYSGLSEPPARRYVHCHMQAVHDGRRASRLLRNGNL